MINFSLLDEAYPNDDKIQKKKKKNDDKDTKEQCKPLESPSYTNPNLCADESVKKFINILDMTDNDNNYKKDGIRGYDYDEMDAYLTVSDIKTNNTDKTEEYRTTSFLANYLKSLRDNFKTNQVENIEQFTNMNNIKIDVNLYNLFLFIFLGIVIIILIDQISKLVSSV